MDAEAAPTDLLLAVIKFWAEEDQRLAVISPFRPDFGDDLIIRGSKGFIMIYYGVGDEDEDLGLMYTLHLADGDPIDGYLEAADPSFFLRLEALVDLIR